MIAVENLAVFFLLPAIGGILPILLVLLSDPPVHPGLKSGILFGVWLTFVVMAIVLWIFRAGMVAA